jgi:acetyl esterase
LSIIAERRASTPADPVDPMIREFIREISRGFASYPDLASMTNAEIRQVAEGVRERWRRGGPAMERVDERRIPAGDHSVRVRFYHPPRETGEASAKACLVYMHGGGWTMFSLDTHDRVMREYAARSGLIVAGVDYALSPEAKFPTALQEVVHVIRWLEREGPSVGVDPSRLLAGGDSAGGNLALAASLQLRDSRHGSPVRGLLLNYGAYARHLSDEAIQQYGGPDFMLTAREMETFWTNYLGGSADAADPLASPILADPSGLPPTFLAVAECDILAEQNMEMGRRLETAGVVARTEVYRGATHSFLEAVSIAPLADRALGDAGEWMRNLAASIS